MDSYGETQRVKHQVMSALPPNWPEECARLVCRSLAFWREILFANLGVRLRQSNCILRIRIGGVPLYIIVCLIPSVPVV